MTITLQAVNELIQSLESAGELSIKERKYLELAKAYLDVAAENVALKASGSCLVSEYMMNKGTDSEFIACITPSKKTIGTGGVWDMWRYLDLMLSKTPATDRIVAEAEARGVEKFAAKLRIPGDDQFFDAVAEGVAGAADAFAKQLREGADK